MTTTATAASHVSGNPYSITASGAVDSDYTISYVAGSLTVNPVALTITANNQTKAYGAALPGLTVSYAGFVNGDTSDEPDHAADGDHHGHGRQSRFGQPLQHHGQRRGRTATTRSATWRALTVNPVALTITADNQSKAYGAALPTLTVSYAGFVNGDTAASLTTPRR